MNSRTQPAAPTPGEIIPLAIYRPVPAARTGRWSFLGYVLEMSTWTNEEWEAIPEPDRPEGARPLEGGGWGLLRMIEDRAGLDSG